MPVWGVLVVRLRELPDAGDINRWRRDLLTDFDPGIFSHDGPLEIVRGPHEGPVPVQDASTWLDLGTTLAYYGRGYERGDPELYVRLADWLERRIPGSEVWYGTDEADESIKPFGTHEREALMACFREVGHEPYNARPTNRNA